MLCIFQAMDAGGKDGAIKHVFSGVNPQGCHVTSFKAPGRWSWTMTSSGATRRTCPTRGVIGIHNRSWYEEVLVVRVHPEVLDEQNLPPECGPASASARSGWRTSRPSSATWRGRAWWC